MGRVVEGFSLNELHDDEEHPVNVTEVVDGDEVRVIEACHGLGLCFKGGAETGVFTELAGKDFNRDRAIEGFLAGLVDCSHATLGDECFQLIGWEERGQFFESRGDELGRGRR